MGYTVAVDNASTTAPAKAVPYMERTRKLYASQPPYRWVSHDEEVDGIPWTPIEGSLEDKRIAVMSSGGVYCDDDEPFHFRNDTSIRKIPLEAEPTDLRVAHFGYDTTDAKRDPACVLPTRALRELAAEGEIASVVDPALSFMGGIYSPRLVRDELAPVLRDFVLHEQADLVLLVPV